MVKGEKKNLEKMSYAGKIAKYYWFCTDFFFFFPVHRKGLKISLIILWFPKQLLGYASLRMEFRSIFKVEDLNESKMRSCILCEFFFFRQLWCKPVCVKDNMMDTSQDFSPPPIYLSVGHIVQLIKYFWLYFFPICVPSLYRTLLSTHLGI